MKLLLGIVLFASYLIALISAFLVFPYLWLVLSLILTALGGFYLYKYRFNNTGVSAIGIFTNGVFIALGQYLENYVPAISIPVNLFGAALTIPMMILFYYWKEGQRRVEVRVKHEKAEEIVVDMSIWQRYKVFRNIRKRKNELMVEKKIPTLLAWQYAYVEYREALEKEKEVNALYFVLGREVVLERNEYDQNPESS